jgi:glycolate oxidase FAD binding subunit
MKQAAASVPSRLAGLVGTEHVISEASLLSAYEVDGVRPSVSLRPGTAAEVVEIIRLAASERLAVLPSAGRTMLGIGMPPQRYDVALDLSRMDRVLAFDPSDLTLGVEPGVRFEELEKHLALSRQFLPLAPAFAGRATLGGMIAAGADSPLRHAHGSARDQILGLEFVSGAGVAAKSGGRVVKNVSGYDMHQLLVGSLGTLAVITRLNFRTLPIPPAERIFVASFSSQDAALELCRTLAKSPLQPRLVEVVNPLAGRILASAHIQGDRWSVVVGVAAHPVVVDRHQRDLDRLAREARASGFLALDGAEHDQLFAAVREFPRLVLESGPGAAIFRMPVLPTAMPSLLREVITVSEQHGLQPGILVRASGVAYAAVLPPDGDSGAQSRLAAACRDLMAAAIRAGAQPMIEWCPAGVKREVGVWPPPSEDQGLALKLKQVFDPHGILAPGRFLGGF